MNLLFASLVVLSIIMVIPAYAEIYELNVDNDNNIVRLSGSGEPRTQITMNIWNESGDLVYDSFFLVDLEGELGFTLPTKHFSEVGKYTGELAYEGGTEQFSFEIFGFPPILDLQIDDKGEISLIPESEYNRVLQENESLRSQIFDLENEIESLKEQRQRMQEDFFQTIREQLDYFLSLSNQ